METTMTMPIATERPVRAYLHRVKILLTSPGRFFREEFPSLSLSEALAFGLVSGWISAAISFALETLNSLLLVSLFDQWVQRLFASDEAFSFLGLSGSSFLWSAGFLLLAPFFFLVRLLLGSVVLYLFARLLIDDEANAVNFRSVLGLRACAFGGQWFGIVPFVGGLLAFIANLALLISGVRERFQVSGRRAAVVVLAPYFFLFLAAFLVTILFLLALSQLPAIADFSLGRLPI